MGTSNGQMDPCMRDSGLAARRTVEASSTGRTVSSMMASSRKMNAMATVCCTIHAAKSLKVSGRMAKRMADAYTHGQMVHSIMSFTSTERNREKEF